MEPDKSNIILDPSGRRSNWQWIFKNGICGNADIDDIIRDMLRDLDLCHDHDEGLLQNTMKSTIMGCLLGMDAVRRQDISDDAKIITSWILCANALATALDLSVCRGLGNSCNARYNEFYARYIQSPRRKK